MPARLIRLVPGPYGLGLLSFGAKTSMISTATKSECDDLLRNAVIAALRSSGYRLLWGLECKVHDDSVILTGLLPSFYLKQVAQTVVMSVDQVKEVRNAIEVHPS